MKRVMGYVLIFVKNARHGYRRMSRRDKIVQLNPLNVEILNSAFLQIIKMLQIKHFQNEICQLSLNKTLLKDNAIQGLNPLVTTRQ